MSSDNLLALVRQTLDVNKAEDIVVIDIRENSSLADFMVIANGRSNTHVSALAEYLQRTLKKAGERPLSVEGLPSADWVIIDANDVIVHIFRPEVRDFYQLDKMWLHKTDDSDALVRIG